jgi:arylsulfatase A-like enzyme
MGDRVPDGSSRARARRRLAAALVASCAACGPAPEVAAPPSIVLISVDSLRADRLGVYGAERDTSPAIDALAAEGARFAEALSTTSWTLPSHASLLTGLSIPAHRVRKPRHRIDPARTLLAEHLADQGYRTAAFVSAPFLDRKYGFAQGFEVYENLQPIGGVSIPPPMDLIDASHAGNTADTEIDAALAWLAERPPGEEPWFLFLHLWDVHYDYTPPEPYARMFDPEYAGALDVTGFRNNPAIHPGMAARDLAHVRARYDAGIRWIDAQLARLLAAVRAREPGDRILVSLVSDHGDEFFEHGGKGHYQTLYEESLRIPWLVRLPGVVPAGTVVEGPVALDDVAPTLLALAGLPPLAEATGRDLSPWATGASASPIPGAVLLTLYPRAALRAADWKVIVDTKTGETRAFDLIRDPGEQQPAAGSPRSEEVLARLEEALDHAAGLSWSGTVDVSLDAKTRDQLEALGYLE